MQTINEMIIVSFIRVISATYRYVLTRRMPAGLTTNRKQISSNKYLSVSAHWNWEGVYEKNRSKRCVQKIQIDFYGLLAEATHSIMIFQFGYIFVWTGRAIVDNSRGQRK